MESIQQHSIRVTIPNRKPEGHKTEPIGLLRTSVLSELGLGRIKFNENERRVLESRPKEQLLRRLIALRHQCQENLEENSKKFADANARISASQKKYGENETMLNRYSADLKAASVDIATSIENEKLEIKLNEQKISVLTREFDDAVSAGNEKFLIKSKLEIAGKYVLATLTRKMIFWLVKNDPGLYLTRKNAAGRFILNSYNSFRNHKAWKITTEYQREFLNFTRFVIKDELLTSDTHLPFATRKNDLLQLSESIRHNIGYTNEQIKNVDAEIKRAHGKVNTNRRHLHILGRYSITPGIVSSVNAAKSALSIDESLNIDSRDAWNIVNSVLATCIQDMEKKCQVISTYIQAMDNLNDLGGKTENLESGLKTVKKAESEIADEIRKLETEKGRFLNIMSIADNECRNRIRQIMDNKKAGINGKAANHISVATTHAVVSPMPKSAQITRKKNVRLPIITAQEFEAALIKAGFEFIRQPGTSHKIYQHPDGRHTIVTGRKEDMEPFLLRRIINTQLKMSTREFLKFLNCHA